MSTSLTLPDTFRGTLASAFSGETDNDLGAGISTGYSVIGYRGKVWSVKQSGNETPLMRPDGDGARASIDVVIVRSSAHISKIFYKSGYQDGANIAPDCWSNNGVTPDAGATNKQAATCNGCPNNAWGSRITDAGKSGKACSDSKRLAVVPLEDLRNETFGGPMLLRVPAASLKEMKQYADMMAKQGFPYFAIATKIAFDHKEAYPKFVFTPIRPLNEQEAAIIKELRDDPQTARVLAEQETASPPPLPASFSLPPAGVAAAPPQKAVAKATPKPAEPAPTAPSAKAPEQFDAMLDDLLTDAE